VAYTNRTEVERLLDQLCTDLGFCLPESQYARLKGMLPMSVDAFTDAVFWAEGLEPQAKTDLRKQVRERVANKFSEMVTNDAT
jgi:hypothetical protein